MGMLMLEATGPEAERLALAAGERTGIAVGYGDGLATFDSDDHDEAELEAAVSAALDELDPDWRSQLAKID